MKMTPIMRKGELAVANRVWVRPVVGNCGFRRNHSSAKKRWTKHTVDGSEIWLTTRKDLAKTLWIMGNLSYQLVQDFWTINSIIRKHVIWTSRWWLNFIPGLPHWDDVIAAISYGIRERNTTTMATNETCTKHALTKKTVKINTMFPIQSMYDIFTYISLVCIVNVGKYITVPWILWVLIWPLYPVRIWFLKITKTYLPGEIYQGHECLHRHCGDISLCISLVAP